MQNKSEGYCNFIVIVYSTIKGTLPEAGKNKRASFYSSIFNIIIKIEWLR